jgi:hypothetical protein
VRLLASGAPFPIVFLQATLFELKTTSTTARVIASEFARAALNLYSSLSTHLVQVPTLPIAASLSFQPHGLRLQVIDSSFKNVSL